MQRDRWKSQPWLPYVAPMAVFLALTALEGAFTKSPGAASRYPFLYMAKFVIVSVVAWLSRASWRDLRPWPGAGGLLAAFVTGLVVAALWVSLDGHYFPLPFAGKRPGFDPTALPPSTRAAFLTVRLLGLVLLVPLIEELFWRSFVVRWTIHPEFRSVPIGRVTPIAAAVSSVLFAVVHPEWLPALLTGLLWVWLLARTRSVSACLVSHAVANLVLGIYILTTGAWRFW